jgi:hypothetical protein
VRETKQRLQEAVVIAADEDAKQTQLDALHQEKLSVYRRRISQLEESLRSEQEFAAAIRQQVGTVSGSNGAAAANFSAPEASSSVAPPWALK